MSYAPVALAATKAAGVESVAAVFNDMDQWNSDVHMRMHSRRLIMPIANLPAAQF